jgi:two-component system sensor histidine kinase YesM
MSQKTLQDISKGKTNRLGIVNVVNRIEILYGEKYKVELKSQMGKGTEITINLPINY